MEILAASVLSLCLLDVAICRSECNGILQDSQEGQCRQSRAYTIADLECSGTRHQRSDSGKAPLAASADIHLVAD